METRVYAALLEEAHEGWVWMRMGNLPPRGIVCIANHDSGRRVYVEALQFDRNYLRRYNNSPRKKLPAPDSSDLATCMVVNGWYRAKLGMSLDERKANLCVTGANHVWGRLGACLDHPQVGVRAAAWLGIISVALGALSILLALPGLLHGILTGLTELVQTTAQ